MLHSMQPDHQLLGFPAASWYCRCQGLRLHRPAAMPRRLRKQTQCHPLLAPWTTMAGAGHWRASTRSRIRSLAEALTCCSAPQLQRTSTVGVLGGGQLGKMLGLEAVRSRC